MPILVFGALIIENNNYLTVLVIVLRIDFAAEIFQFSVFADCNYLLDFIDDGNEISPVFVAAFFRKLAADDISISLIISSIL